MAQLYIKANELEEKDTVKVFNERGKEVYYTKDDFIATGHRIKIFMADTISEVAYVQEKYDGDIVRFEFCARDKFGTIERDFFTLAQNYNIDFDEDWDGDEDFNIADDIITLDSEKDFAKHGIKEEELVAANYIKNHLNKFKK